jgi:hypothetical protein
MGCFSGYFFIDLDIDVAGLFVALDLDPAGGSLDIEDLFLPLAGSAGKQAGGREEQGDGADGVFHGADLDR